MDIGGTVAQQFMGPLSELVHTINKLTIVKSTVDAKPTSSLFGSGAGGAIASAAIGATGLGGAVSAVQKIVEGGGDDKFELQINPEKYDRRYTINHSSPRAQNRSKNQHKMDGVGDETLSLSFTLDGTGVVPSSVSDLGNFALQTLTKAIGVTDVSYVTRRIKELKKVVYDYEPKKHETPAQIKVIWGDEKPFLGRMQDLRVSYTLFHPSGVPLRAEIQIEFIGHDLTPQPRSSPDLTHRRTVAQSDTLLLLTEEVYGDNTFAWQVAEANGLTHYRRLKTGATLYFPPLERRFLRS